jgi:hypothetical protein
MFIRSSRMLALGATLALTVFVANASPVPAAKPVTLGQFAVQISKALGTPVDSEETAATSLRLAGAHIDADLSSPLTEGRAADIMRDLGVPAQVSGDPSAPMTPGKAGQAATSVALSIATEADGFSSESMPTTCTGVRDRTSCFTCCDSFLSQRTRHPLAAALLCGVICGKLFPPVSAWHPLGR